MQTYTMKLIAKKYESVSRKSKLKPFLDRLYFEVPSKYLVKNGGDLTTLQGYDEYLYTICIDLRGQSHSLENYDHLQVGESYTLVYIDLDFDDKGLWFVITGDALDDVNHRDDLRLLTK